MAVGAHFALAGSMPGATERDGSRLVPIDEACPMSTPIPCPGCRTSIEPDALFCVQCGLCVLSLVRERTVVMPVRDRWPADTPARGKTAPQRLPPTAVRTGLTVCVSALDEEIEIGLDDVEIEAEPRPFVFRPPPLPERVTHRKIRSARATALPAVPLALSAGAAS
jgi:hypothetical protein